MLPSPRRAAADVLVAVLDDGRTLEDALAQTKSFAQLAGRDRAFARAIASAALRRLGGIDAVLARFLAKPLPASARLARALLRTGAAQLLVLDTPPHAAVSETVALANADRSARGFAKLINAVLRRAASEGSALFTALDIGVDLPAWLFARWRATYGETAVPIAAALRAEPPLDLTPRRNPEEWAEKLRGIALPTGSVRLPAPARTEPADEAADSGRSGSVTRLPGYAEGAWWVQDAAAALPARLLGDVREKDVLDLCAAPGGKTLQLSAAGARVTALDKAQDRLDLLRANLGRTRLSAEVVCADALDWSPARQFDAILLDAPCTSTGTLRRHPDAAWLRRPNDIRTLATLQANLLERAASFLKPGGRLVYAVCSLEPEEGQERVAAALKNGWKREPVAPAELHGGAEFVTPEGDLRTLPSHWPDLGGMDGFFAARLTH
jgi:16S rRNA (cytosine967-C5)-methyltransferase